MRGSAAGRATAFLVLGMLGMEVGAALAVLMFPQVGALGMVMLRLVFSAVILLLLARPSLRGHSARDWRGVIFFGLALVSMNSMFYLALERLSLGVTVTIEVLGPLVLSIVTSRRRSAWLWAGVAFLGVLALGGGWSSLDPIGVLFALGAAASWAFYILGSHRVGKDFPKLEGLALAMTVGAIVALPFGIASAGAALLDWKILGLGLAVALLSSTIPYAFELIALRSLTPATFSVLMSLGPALASLAGFAVLQQSLAILEIIGIVLVIGASMGAVLTMQPRPDTTAEPLA